MVLEVVHIDVGQGRPEVGSSPMVGGGVGDHGDHRPAGRLGDLEAAVLFELLRAVDAPAQAQGEVVQRMVGRDGEV